MCNTTGACEIFPCWSCRSSPRFSILDIHQPGESIAWQRRVVSQSVLEKLLEQKNRVPATALLGLFSWCSPSPRLPLLLPTPRPRPLPALPLLPRTPASVLSILALFLPLPGPSLPLRPPISQGVKLPRRPFHAQSLPLLQPQGPTLLLLSLPDQ